MSSNIPVFFQGLGSHRRLNQNISEYFKRALERRPVDRRIPAIFADCAAKNDETALGYRESFDRPMRSMLKDEGTTKFLGELFLSQTRPLIGTTIGVTRLHDGVDKVPSALGDDRRAFFERFH